MTDQLENQHEEDPWRAWLRYVALTLHRHAMPCLELTSNEKPMTEAARPLDPNG